MELRHLRYFVAIAEAGTYVEASRRLNLAQAALSKQIQDLERELGVQLFERQSRGVRLTRAGEEFLAHARQMLATAAQAIEEVRRIATGSARIGVSAFEGGRLLRLALRTAVAELRVQHPNVAVELEFLPYAAQPAALRERRLDLGFAFGELPDAEGVALVPFVSYVADGVLLADLHPLAAKPEVPLAALERLPLLMLPSRREAVPMLLDHLRFRPQVQRLPDPSTLRSSVLFGDGWIFDSLPLGNDGSGGLAYRPLADGVRLPFSINVLQREDERDPIVLAFVELLLAARDTHQRAESEAARARPAAAGVPARARAPRRPARADDRAPGP